MVEELKFWRRTFKFQKCGSFCISCLVERWRCGRVRHNIIHLLISHEPNTKYMPGATLREQWDSAPEPVVWCAIQLRKQAVYSAVGKVLVQGKMGFSWSVSLGGMREDRPEEVMTLGQLKLGNGMIRFAGLTENIFFLLWKQFMFTVASWKKYKHKKKL